MFTKWSQVENWIRDNGLTSWRFSYDKTGTQTTADGEEKQVRSNRLAILSDAFPGDLEEKIALTKRRLVDENNQVLYGYGKRGKENTGLMYCEVRLVDELQQPGAQAVSSVPQYPAFDEDKMMAKIRREVQLEYENQRYQDERKAFEKEKKEFEAEKKSAIGAVVHFMSPVLAALSGKQIAGVDASAPVQAAPIHAVEDPADHAEVDTTGETEDEIFSADEQEQLFDLMIRFKAVEPRYLELIEKVVTMAETGDSTYDMAKRFLL